MLCIPYLAFCQVGKGGLKVFIENAEDGNIIGVRATVLDADSQIAIGVTDFQGFLHIPNLTTGTHELRLAHTRLATSSITVRIVADETLVLRTEWVSVRMGCFGTIGLQSSSEHYITTNQMDTTKSGLRVFIDNMPELELEGCHVKVYQGGKLICKRGLDATGFVDMVDMKPGAYEVRIKHRNLGSVRKFVVLVEAEKISQLHAHFYKKQPRYPSFLMRSVSMLSPGHELLWFAPYGSKSVYRSEDILQSSSTYRN